MTMDTILWSDVVLVEVDLHGHGLSNARGFDLLRYCLFALCSTLPVSMGGIALGSGCDEVDSKGQPESSLSG